MVRQFYQEQFQQFSISTWHPSNFGKIRKNDLQQIGKPTWYLWQVGIPPPPRWIYASSGSRCHRDFWRPRLSSRAWNLSSRTRAFFSHAPYAPFSLAFALLPCICFPAAVSQALVFLFLPPQATRRWSPQGVADRLQGLRYVLPSVFTPNSSYR
jgi:hypothetical protein